MTAFALEGGKRNTIPATVERAKRRRVVDEIAAAFRLVPRRNALTLPPFDSKPVTGQPDY